MEYNKGTSGDWLNADSVQNGQKIKIISECVKQDSKFKDKEGNSKSENIAKVRLQGADKSVNMRINWASKRKRKSKSTIIKQLIEKHL